MKAISNETTAPPSGTAESISAARRTAFFASMIATVTLAFVNYAAGHLGLQLAIPPGFATAVFPPAGIALAALLIWGDRLWPGILLGSLALNVQLSLATSSELTLLGAAPVAASIAIGSTLQALLAAKVIRHCVQAPTRLTHESDVIGLLLIGGPIGCIAASSWGISTLFLAGLQAPGTLAAAWLTWWIGDMIGVLIFTPLVLCLFARPRSLWKPRRLPVALPLAIAFTLVVCVYVVVSERAEEAIAAGFERRVEVLDRSLERSLQSHEEVLWSIRSFFAGSEEVSREEFETFVQRALAAYPGLTGLGWNPLVTSANRAATEEALTREMGRPFEVRSRDSNGILVRAAEADEHVFVKYIEPRAGNEAAIGFDVFSEPIRRSAIERARDSGEPSASERIALVQDPNGGFGYLLMLPIYDTDATPSTIHERRNSVRGYAVAVIQIESVIDAAFADLALDGIDFELWDESATEAGHLLGSRRTRAPTNESATIGTPYSVKMTHNVGGRKWTFRYAPSSGYLSEQPTWQAWAVLASGLSCTGLLGALLLVITGRAALETESQATFAGMNRRLEITNQELAGFAYAASHDLRSPLRAVSQIAEYIILDHGDAMPTEAREHLELIRDRIARMTRLLDDLLEYSRAGWMNEKPVLVDTGELVNEIAALMPDRDRFTVRGIDLPEIYTVSVPLEQVLRNLCSNAVKHHDLDSGLIEVHCVEEGDAHVFSVCDDGPGIPQEDRERVFEMFQRGTARTGSGGSGMGLSLVRKLVTNRGGKVWIESEGDRGTVIHFRWPNESAEGTDDSA